MFARSRRPGPGPRRSRHPAARRLAFSLRVLPALMALSAMVPGMAGPARAADPAAADPIFSRWETLTTRDGLPDDKVTAVAVDGPTLWAGTEGGLAAVTRVSGADRWQARPVEGLPFPVVSALAVSRATGDLWIGTLGGLARLSGGRVDRYTQIDSGLANDVIYGVAVDGTDVWVATASGLNRLDTTTGLWDLYDTTNTLMHEPWTYAVTARDGTVWVAVWGGGVVVRERGADHFRDHRDPDGEMEIDLFRDDGLVHDVTSGVAVDGDILWVATYFGLSRYDGRRWRSFSRDDSGLAGDFINTIRADRGVLWIGTDQGLSRFDSASWHTWRRTESGRTDLFVTAEGARPSQAGRPLPPQQGLSSNTIYGIDLDGRDVWLATASGLVHAVGRVPQGATDTHGGRTR